MREAVRLAGITLPSLWPLWLAGAGLNVASAFWVKANVGPDMMLTTEQLLAYAIVVSVPSGVLIGVCLRAMLGVGRDRWRMDRGIVGYTLIGMALALAELWPAGLLADAAEAGIADPYLRQWGMYLAGAVVWFALLYPASRLLVWPIRHLMGDTSATPAESWRIMRGAAIPYALALVLLSTPFYVADLFAWERFFYFQSYLGMAIACVVDAAWDAVWCGLAAAAYRVRVLDSERLAEVFG